GAAGHLRRALELASEPSLERAETLRETAALHEAAGRAAEARDAYARARDLFDSLGMEGFARDVAWRLESIR
ncbi:MAG TPA: hypothetical protein VHG91_13715, partial [Longimicrobium sp.]|nr:hypothetical protein [Longimicrobium sp.]